MVYSFESTNKKTLQNTKDTMITCKDRLCGYYSKEDTPVPIPNTEVKLFSADGTWRATSWESKT